MSTARLIRPSLLLVLLSAALCAFAWSLIASLRAQSAPAKTSANWTIFGKQGDNPGEFQQPRGITGFPDGSFVVVDRAARVQHFFR